MTILEINAQTQEVIERDATEVELVQRELDNQANIIRATELEEQATARKAVLDRLGITAEEAQLILGGSN